MKTIGLAIFIATVIDALVEYGQTIYDWIEEGDKKKAIKQGAAILLGILFAFEIKITLLTWLIADLFDGIAISPIFDCIVSGIFMSRGANYLSDFIRFVHKIGTHEDMYDDWEDDGEEEDEDELTTEGNED